MKDGRKRKGGDEVRGAARTNRSGRRAGRRSWAGSLALTVGALSLALAVAPAWAAELVTNGGFATDLSGWKAFTDANRGAAWSPMDANGSGSSGSAELTNTSTDAAIAVTPMFQCAPVQAGEDYHVSAKLMVKSGQARTGKANWAVIWYSNTDCFGNSLEYDIVGDVTSPGSWVEIQDDYTAPAGAVGAKVVPGLIKSQAGGTFTAYFDEASILPADEAPPGGAEECQPLPGPYLTDSDFPGFRFKVEITNSAGSLAASPEAACLPETVCLSGALTGRTEAELRLIGPRPNGHLWFEMIRFSPSALRIRVEKVSDGTCRFYDIPAVPAGSDALPGFVDRTAFTP